MSRGGRSEQVDDLRGAIARIEGDGSIALRFGADGAPRKAALGQGVQGAEGGQSLALDRVLRGGLRRGSLTEVVAAAPADAAATSGFALALAARFAAGTRAPIVWIVEDGASRETGAPYAPGLAAHGLDPGRLVMVRTLNGADSLWAMEEALKCRSVAAVVTDLWRTRSYDLVASRRLVLAAAKGGTPGLLVPAGAAGSAAALSSAAQTRFEVRAGASPGLASAAVRTPLPGRAAWAVRLARIRAGPAGSAAFDWQAFWPLVWDHQEAWLCDALPLPAPALPGDGPHPATARRAA